VPNLNKIVPTKKHYAELIEKANPQIVRIICEMESFCRDTYPSPNGPRYFRVTSIYRSPKKQLQIYNSIKKNNPTYSGVKVSPHCFGNAFDLSIYDQFGIKFHERDISKMVGFLNTKFQYGNNTGTLTAVRHVGTADHIHVQVNWRQHGNGYTPPEAELKELLK